MATQHYDGTVHLEPNTKYTISIVLPGISKTWSFTSRYRTAFKNVDVYTSRDEVMRHLREFGSIFSGHDVYLAIKYASDKAEELLVFNNLDETTLTDTRKTAFDYARKMFCTFQAAVDLASAVYLDLVQSGGRYSKRLGDLQIDKQSMSVIPQIKTLRDYLQGELEYWRDRLLSFWQGNITAGITRVVRGSKGSPYPLSTRIW